MALPAATKVVQWGGSDVYKVGGKVFAICGLRGGLSFKVSEIGFEVLTEGGPARQAPYCAKGHLGDRGAGRRARGRYHRLAGERPRLDRREADQGGEARAGAGLRALSSFPAALLALVLLCQPGI